MTTTNDATGPTPRLRRALLSLAQLRALVPPMTASADTHADDVRDALREYEAEVVALAVKVAHLRRSV